MGKLIEGPMFTVGEAHMFSDDDVKTYEIDMDRGDNSYQGHDGVIVVYGSKDLRDKILTLLSECVNEYEED